MPLLAVGFREAEQCRCYGDSGPRETIPERAERQLFKAMQTGMISAGNSIALAFEP
jgi:hypothetical protein